jgi:hypothetical protein
MFIIIIYYLLVSLVPRLPAMHAPQTLNTKQNPKLNPELPAMHAPQTLNTKHKTLDPKPETEPRSL